MKEKGSLLYLFVTIILWLAVTACLPLIYATQTVTEIDAETAVETGTETTAETETDTDTDTDTDTNSETTADSDTDTDSETDTETTADSDKDSDTETKTEIEIDTDKDTMEVTEVSGIESNATDNEKIESAEEPTQEEVPEQASSIQEDSENNPVPVTPDGSGADHDPYIIKTFSNLKWLAKQEDTTGYTFLLDGNFEAPTSSGPIIPDFDGVFIGNNHTILLEINASDDEPNIGLFGRIGQNGIIKNLHVSGNVAVTGKEQMVGGIAGVNEGTIENSGSSVNVTGISSEQFPDGLMGGVAGHNTTTGIIRNSYSEGNVVRNDDTARKTFGIVDGTISSKSVGIGGLVGGNFGIIELSFSSGTVEDRPNNGIYTGGLVGINFGYVNKSYATGSVSGNILVGGLIGVNGGSVLDCFSSGNVVASSDVGGLIGSVGMGCEILRTFSTGDVTSIAEATSHGSKVGGLIGFDGNEEVLGINNSVAINGNITAYDKSFVPDGRIIGLSWSWAGKGKVYNRAYIGTKINGEPFSGDGSDANSHRGLDVTLEELMDKNFWIQTMGWSEDVWSFPPGKLPGIRDIQANGDFTNYSE